MYSVTFCVRVMLPERHQWKPAVQAAAVMLRRPPVDGQSPASQPRNFENAGHSNATRTPIANPPNSAQLGGIPYHYPSYIRVRAVVWAYCRGQTDTQTRVTTIHFASSTTRTKCNDSVTLMLWSCLELVYWRLQ